MCHACPGISKIYTEFKLKDTITYCVSNSKKTQKNENFQILHFGELIKFYCVYLQLQFYFVK